jgi:dolichol kinase
MLELRRKMMHIACGIIIVLLIKAHVLWKLSAFIVLAVGFVLSMISRKRRLPIIGWFLDRFDRPGTSPPGKGALTYMLSVFVLLMLFGDHHPEIVYASIIILALGDSMAALVGRRVKESKLAKTPHPLSANKVLEGTLFGFMAAALGAMVFVSILEAILASAVAMVIEGLELHYGEDTIDDNLLVPLSAAAVMFVLRLVLM